MTKLVDYHEFRPSTTTAGPYGHGMAAVGGAEAEDDYWSSPRAFESPRRRTLSEQCWYHGRIKRIEAVQLLRHNGDFLVRDSISCPGDYVLTGLCRGEPMHFEIHRAPSSDPLVSLFYFEDEQFRSIVDLVQFYVTHRRQVTAKSQFILVTPVAKDVLTVEMTRLQAEIEAAYAPFVNKHTPPHLVARIDRSLSHTAILNQAKKRLNGSEHDLVHLLATTEPSSSSSSSSIGGGVRVTSFGDQPDCAVETTVVPPRTCRPLPRFSPPKSPVAMATPEDLDDYDDIDYDSMEAQPAPSRPQPPVVPPKPAALRSKRHSEFLEERDPSPPFPEPTRKHSAHSLFQATSPTEDEREPDPLPAFLDRTQSCQNLTYRQRSRSGREEVEEVGNGFQRYPSVKIEPAPWLPARSTTSLNSLGVLANAQNHSPESQDYDDLTPATAESDYDRLRDKVAVAAPPPSTQTPKPTPSSSSLSPSAAAAVVETPRPRTFAQLRAATQPAKQVRNLLHFLSSLTAPRLALLITSEDIKVFKLADENGAARSDSLRRLFLAESRSLREEILDRSACLQLIVATSIQRSIASKEICKLWILAASHLLHKIGNGFAFGAIMASLKVEMLKKQRSLSELDSATIAIFRGLVPVYDDFHTGKMPVAIAGCFLPFVQPLLQLLSKSDYVQTGRIKNMNCIGLEHLEVLSNLILLARHVLLDNASQLGDNVRSSVTSGTNPLSTESLVHCLLATPCIGELKESERRKIRQLFEQQFEQ